ncbi:MAG: hypothetical protein PVI71_10890 [Desulfobacterales bacterium]|jgi:hypothetical protein
MHAPSNKIVKYILGLIPAALFSTIIFAYVLEGPHIIQLMAEQLGQADSLFISQKVVFYNIQPQPESLIQNDSCEADNCDEENLDSHSAVSAQADEDQIQLKTIQLDESLRYVFSEAFRSDIVSDDNQRIFVFRDGQTLTVIDGVISGGGETRFDHYKDLLLYRSREALSERLSSLGIDISVSSLGKFEGQIAFVLGAEYPDESLPQVWIDMQTFHPLRLIIPSGSSTYSTDILEIRYSDWRKIGNIWYPMRTEFIQDSITVRAIEVNDYQVNPTFSKDIFDIARLKLEYRQPAKTSTHTDESDGLSEVQKTIEEFKKIFE